MFKNVLNSSLTSQFKYHLQILADGMAGAAQTALRMLCDPAYATAEQEITDFFLALFTAVLPQLGNFAYSAIDVFLVVAQR